MSDQNFPPGWDEARIREVIEHYDSQDEDERAAEIESAWEAEGMTLMSVPTELVPEIRACSPASRPPDPDRQAVLDQTVPIVVIGKYRRSRAGSTCVRDRL